MVDEDDAAPAGTFINRARREQLVASAIGALAELGFQRASTVRIAERAGVSRGVLTYHFADRQDLLDAVVAEVYRVAGDELIAAIAAAPTPREALATYIGGSIDFYLAHPDHMAALSEIFGAARRADAPGRELDERHGREHADVVALLRAGQEAGQFRAFDVDTMAAVIRAALDAGLGRVRREGVAEPLRSELVATIDAATRR